MDSSQETPGYDLFPIRASIPKVLRDLPNWANWTIISGPEDNDEKLAELVSMPTTFEIAIETSVQSELPMGIGLHLDAGDPYIAVQILDAYAGDFQRAYVAPIVDAMQSYTECNREMGTITIWAIGKADNIANERLRIINSGFIPINGNTYHQKPADIGIRHEQLTDLISRYAGPTYMQELRRIAPYVDIPPREALAHVLTRRLEYTNWSWDPDFSRLYEFLGLCWPYPELQSLLHQRMSEERWTKDRRNQFVACIYPPIERKRQEDNTPAIIIPEPLQGDQLEDLLQINSRGKIQETYYNYATILHYHPEWQGKLQFDTFRETSIISGDIVTDALESQVALWFGKYFGFTGNNPKLLARGIYSAAMEHQFDSLINWVNELPPWDGQSRIKTWICPIFGAPMTLYAMWIGYIIIMQMMARALQPGCQARYVPILEGEENTGKTKAIKILGDPWSITFDMSMDSKEAHMMIHGVWVAELAELETLRKTAETRLKSFVTQTEDTYVPKFYNHKVSYKRRTVFIGSTNEDNYLPGVTGNTRWLPLKTGIFDIEGLVAIRDQLFAEAASIFKATPDVQWWEVPGSLAHIVKAERDERRMINIFEDPLADYLNGKNPKYPARKDQITFPDICKEFLEIETPERWKDGRLQMQIAQALRALGWRPARINSTRFWVRSDTPTGQVEDTPF